MYGIGSGGSGIAPPSLMLSGGQLVRTGIEQQSMVLIFIGIALIWLGVSVLGALMWRARREGRLVGALASGGHGWAFWRRSN